MRFSTTVAVADTVVLGGRRRHADNTDPACDANAQCSSGLGSGETEESDHSAEGRGESKSARKSKLKELSAKQAAKRANPYAWLPSCLMRYIHTADPNGPTPAKDGGEAGGSEGGSGSGAVGGSEEEGGAEPERAPESD